MSRMFSIDSLNSIVAFVSTVEAGSFTAAGKRLGLSGSAIGKSVDRLEERLGVSVLHRTTRSISPTAEGRLLYARAKHILASLRDAEDLINSTQKTPRGRLKVSLPTVVSRHIIIPALPTFISLYPDIELDLWVDDHIVDVVADGFDLALRLGNLNDSGLLAKKIMPHQFVTCAAPQYLKKFGIPETPAALIKHHCIRYRFLSTGLVEQWQYSKNISAPLYGQGLVLNDAESLAATAIAGLGIIQAPIYLVERHLMTGRLQQILTGFDAPRGDAWLIWPQGRAELPRVKVFSNFLKDILTLCPYEREKLEKSSTLPFSPDSFNREIGHDLA